MVKQKIVCVWFHHWGGEICSTKKTLGFDSKTNGVGVGQPINPARHHRVRYGGLSRPCPPGPRMGFGTSGNPKALVPPGLRLGISGNDFRFVFFFSK